MSDKKVDPLSAFWLAIIHKLILQHQSCERLKQLQFNLM
ncbi:MAG: hypothetical protein POELPBGB_03628 [Bacteroidia bacterium]|nr:hypothetical protein [Bacteroidia bacterium]